MAKTIVLRDWQKAISADVVLGSRLGTDLVVSDAPDGIPTVTAKSYVGLVRVVGYVKYQSERRVLLRGQTSCYGTMKPSAYRGRPRKGVDAAMETLLGGFRGAAGVDLEPRHEPSTEPFLQHYGVRTRWLDLVDNLLHALFFAAYEQVATSDGRWTHAPTRNDRSFVYLMDCGSDRDMQPVQVVDRRRVAEVSGVWEGSDGFQLCDLRRAKPSKVLRPHAQHGYLCRPGERRADLWDRVLVRVQVEPRDALRWLGSGGAVLPETLFPSPTDDQAFAKLLAPRVSEFLAGAARTADGFDFGSIAEYDHGETAC